MNMILKTAAVLFLFKTLCVQPAFAAVSDEVWVPKSTGGFHIIQSDGRIRVQYELKKEIIDVTGRITNLGDNKEFKGSYLRLETSEGTLIVLLKDIRFLESVKDVGRGEADLPDTNEGQKEQRPNPADQQVEPASRGGMQKAFAVKLGGEIGTTPQGRPWFLSIVFETARNQGVETVIIEFDTPGGVLKDGFSITSQILDARDSGITVIGWVKDALSAGARPALACDRLYVHPNARLGGAEWFSHGVEYEIREIVYKDELYVYAVPQNVIYHRGNDYLPERLRAKQDSYTQAIDRRLAQRSTFPIALIDAMCVMENELWHNVQTNSLSNAQSTTKDFLVDDGRSVLTLNADQMIQFLNANPASSKDEIAQDLNISILDGTDLPYRSTGNAPEIRKLKANLKKSADFRVLAEDVRDKLIDVFERSLRLIELSVDERKAEDARRARALNEWKTSQTSGAFNRRPPKSIRPLEGPAALIPVGRKLSADLRKKVVGCLSMAQRDYDLLEDQIEAMLGVSSVTEFVESSRAIRGELRDPRTTIEFVEFVDVLSDEVLEIFFTQQ